VTDQDLGKYNLLIVGPDTGSLDQWGSEAALSHIRQSERPVLGVGEGGYAFFGRLGLAIGWGNGAHGQGTSILWTAGGDPIWRYPYELDLREQKILQLYKENSPRVGIFLGNQPQGVQVFGFAAQDQRYADLIMESNWWMLWGFQHGPEQMTPLGQDLFVNTAHRTSR
jgi:hypothetical protein